MDASSGLAPHPHAEHDPHQHDAGHDHHELPFWRKYIISTDHKVIGIQYGISGLIFLFFGFSPHDADALAVGVTRARPCR